MLWDVLGGVDTETCGRQQESLKKFASITAVSHERFSTRKFHQRENTLLQVHVHVENNVEVENTCYNYINWNLVRMQKQYIALQCSLDIIAIPYTPCLILKYVHIAITSDLVGYTFVYHSS